MIEFHNWFMTLEFIRVTPHVEILTRAAAADEELTFSSEVIAMTATFFIRLGVSLEIEQIDGVCHSEACKRFWSCAGPPQHSLIRDE